MSRFLDVEASVGKRKRNQEPSDDESEYSESDDGKSSPYSRAKAARSGDTGPLSKYWCFTSFVGQIQRPEDCTYFILQQEVSPTTTKDHWQGYVEFSTKKRRNLVGRLLGDEAAHLELRRGSAQQAADYCRKRDSRKQGTEPYEWGEISKPAVNQMDQVARAVRNGASVSEIADEYSSAFIRYGRGILALKGITDARIPATYKPVKVWVLHGPTGTGKTRFVYEHAHRFHKGIYYPKTFSHNASWWENYVDQSLVVIDDFNGECPIHELLQLFGGYGHNQAWPVKGASVRVVATEFIVTSNKSPDEWWPLCNPEHLAALKRRFTKVYDLSVTSIDTITTQVKQEEKEFIDLT